jgi:hypothetical protein
VSEKPTRRLGKNRPSRLIRSHWLTAPRGYADPDPPYRSRFNFVWWFWLPRIHTQHPDAMNPRVIRLIWLCFAAGLDIWGKESKEYWPTQEHHESDDNRIPNIPKDRFASLEELGLPTWKDIVCTMFNTTSMEAAKAVAHWVLLMDCSPHARQLIRDALDKKTEHNEDAKLLFKCPICCDTNETNISIVKCPNCKLTNKS